MGAPLTITMSRGRKIDLSGPQYYQGSVASYQWSLVSFMKGFSG
jgi:hypothetical protein